MRLTVNMHLITMYALQPDFTVLAVTVYVLTCMLKGKWVHVSYTLYAQLNRSVHGIAIIALYI